MNQIFSFLTGGLGNQMFQYSTARAVAHRSGAELVLDTWSGFVRDRQYRRHYELRGLPIRGRVTTALERVPIWLFRAQEWFVNSSAASHTLPNGALVPPVLRILRRPYGDFLVEGKLCFIPQLIAPLTRSAWLLGYWQSPRYFADIADVLRQELMPPPPVQQNFVELGERLRNRPTVAVGIRLYEESANPGAHARDGRIKQLTETAAALRSLMARCPEAQVALFCTHRAVELEQLELPPDTIYATHDESYIGSLERLWLLAQCRHHLFLNSSYYWWGAWLSAAYYGGPKAGQVIMAADNFVNPDCYAEGWERF